MGVEPPDTIAGGQTVLRPELDRPAKPGTHFCQRSSLVARQLPDVPRINHDAVESHAGSAVRELRQFQREFRRRHAGAAEAHIEINEYSDRRILRSSGTGEPFNGFGRIDGHVK